MNERIRELSDIAYKNHLAKNPHSSFGRRSDYDKEFAELIVKEYEKLLPEICPWADADKEGPMKGWHVQFVARKHFGVES
jgi:hypothetical protein